VPKRILVNFLFGWMGYLFLELFQSSRQKNMRLKPLVLRDAWDWFLPSDGQFPLVYLMFRPEKGTSTPFLNYPDYPYIASGHLIWGFKQQFLEWCGQSIAWLWTEKITQDEHILHAGAPVFSFTRCRSVWASQAMMAMLMGILAMGAIPQAGSGFVMLF